MVKAACFERRKNGDRKKHAAFSLSLHCRFVELIRLERLYEELLGVL